MIPVQSEETGAMGSAILGLAAVTGEKPFEVAARFRRFGGCVRPNPENRVIYNARYEVYKALRGLYLAQRKEKR